MTGTSLEKCLAIANWGLGLIAEGEFFFFLRGGGRVQNRYQCRSTEVVVEGGEKDKAGTLHATRAIQFRNVQIIAFFG